MSRIELLIDEIKEYIDGCHYKFSSKEIILVNKDEIDELLRQLEGVIPEEIRASRKILNNREEIMEKAKVDAQKLIDQATAQTSELISESEIMQQSYARANEIVELATKQAQEILDGAITEANAMKDAAVQYTDDMLANVQNILGHSIEVAENRYQNLIIDLQRCNEIVVNNRAELNQTPGEGTGSDEEGTKEETSEKLNLI